MSCCGGGACACIVNAGNGIEVTGSGTPNDPYLIASTVGGLADLLRVRDTSSVNLVLTGSGSQGDPLELQAISTLRLSELADVDDPSGGPSVGESPVWVGAGSEGHWEFQTPPPAPAGAVNVENGLYGIGDVSDPIGVSTSGVWGSGALSGLGGDSTIGLEIYVDSAGELRAEPVGTPDWGDITGKPSTFPPSSHTHPVADLTDLSTNGNAARVNGIKISSTATSGSPPSSPSVGDLWFFPKDS